MPAPQGTPNLRRGSRSTTPRRRSTADATRPSAASATRSTVSADVFRDGHEILRAVVRYKAPGARRWLEAPLHPIDAHINGVRWEGEFTVETPGRWEWTIEAWSDLFATWRDELQRKVDAGQERPRRRAVRGRRAARGRRRAAPRAATTAPRSSARSTRSKDAAAPRRRARRSRRTCSRPSSASPSATARRACRRPLALEVDRVRARFSSWYELFPRSWGGLKGVEAQIPRDRRARLRRPLLPADPPDRPQEPQGPQQRARRRPRRPRLAVRDRRRRGRPRRRAPRARHARRRARRCAPPPREHGMDVALDFALNASADHPWLTEHPEWFHQRPDGTHQVRREPAQEVPGHLQLQLGHAGLAGAVGGVAADRARAGSTPA